MALGLSLALNSLKLAQRQLWQSRRKADPLNQASGENLMDLRNIFWGIIENTWWYLHVKGGIGIEDNSQVSDMGTWMDSKAFYWDRKDCLRTEIGGDASEFLFGHDKLDMDERCLNKESGRHLDVGLKGGRESGCFQVSSRCLEILGVKMLFMAFKIMTMEQVV